MLHHGQLEDVSRIPSPQMLLVARQEMLLFHWHFPTSLLNSMVPQSRDSPKEGPSGYNSKSQLVNISHKVKYS